MNLQELQEKVSEVSWGYAKAHGIERREEWYILKVQEELWELVQAYLSFKNLWRNRWKTQYELKQDLSFELADIFAHILLFAQYNNIDVEKSLEQKWFKYLK